MKLKKQFRHSGSFEFLIIFIFLFIIFSVSFLLGYDVADSDEIAGRTFLLSIFGLIAGTYIFVRGFRWYSQRKLISDMPTSKIRSLAMGLVEIYGEALPFKKMLKSPVTQRDCVYYEYTIEELRKSGKSSYWAIIKRDESRAHFLLKDSTGRVLIDPKGAEIDIPTDYEFPKPNMLRIRRPKFPKLVDEFLKKVRVSRGYRQLRIREYYIAPKDKLYILGTAGDNPFVAEASGKSNVQDIMIQKGNRGYYISDTSEKHVLRRLTFTLVAALGGGVFLILGSLFLILYLLYLI